MKTVSKITGLFLFAFLFTVTLAVPAHADTKQEASQQSLLQSRLKSALNDMVQDVKTADKPADKRQILGAFIDKVEDRAEVIGAIPFLSKENKVALNRVQEKFAGYEAGLKGIGQSPVADKDLDAYASFMQQDLEQADWGSGGIYLSTGAIIIILLILILIT